MKTRIVKFTRRYKLTLLLIIALSGSRLNAQFSISKALIEVFTASSVIYAPDGFVVLDTILARNPDAMAVNIHWSDSMQIAEANDYYNFYSPSFPQALVGRSGVLFARNYWKTEVEDLLNKSAYVTVFFDSVRYQNSTRKLDVYMQALFTGTLAGDLRLNCVVVEDSVRGTGSGWDQANTYNTTSGHAYFGKGNPISGFYHRYVARKYLGGTWGTSGVIASSVKLGDKFYYHYTYNLPANYDAEKISLVGMVSEYNGNNLTDREIINSVKYGRIFTAPKLNSNPVNRQELLRIYPNPTHAEINVFTTNPGKLFIYSSTGQIVHTTELGEGNSSIQNDLSTGVYYLKFSCNNKVIHQKLIVE